MLNASLECFYEHETGLFTMIRKIMLPSSNQKRADFVSRGSSRGIGLSTALSDIFLFLLGGVFIAGGSVRSKRAKLDTKTTRSPGKAINRLMSRELAE